MTTPAAPRLKLRYEDFGAIVALDEPPALVHIDPQLTQVLGYPPSPRWRAPRGHLSAPTEVHLMLTNRCPAACPRCYTDATPDGAEPAEAELIEVVDRLADFGVFHLALGGGESLLHAGLFRVAAHARARGMVPNLTTSGLGLTPALAEACRVFGRVNVSLDGIGAAYVSSRGYDGAAVALRALERLRAAGVPAGINLVVTRDTFDTLAQTVDAATAAGADEVELLRLKPGGRGLDDGYPVHALDEERARALMPTLVALQQRHPTVAFKVDCSFTPMLCAADPDLDLLKRFGVYGCEAGHVLTAVKADLQATPCSFVPTPVGTVAELVDTWDTSPLLNRWRRYHLDEAPAPCQTCTYRSVCKGGCKAVTQRALGTWFAPDPECPRVLAHGRGEAFVPVTVPPLGAAP